MELNHWWVWMVLAAVFIIGEIFTAGFFLLWFGIGAAVAGLVALLGPGTVWQLTVFVVLSLVLFVLSRRVVDRFSAKQPQGIGANRLIGVEGIVLQRIENVENKGRVRISQEEWRAESESGTKIEEGQSVIVTGVSGTHLVVKPIQGGD